MPAPVTVTIGDAERELLLLALATLAIQQPGWHGALGTLASQFTADGAALDEGRVMFERFCDLHREGEVGG